MFQILNKYLFRFPLFPLRSFNKFFAKFMSTDSSDLKGKKEDVLQVDKDPRKKTDVFNSVLKKVYDYLNDDSLNNWTKQLRIEQFSDNQFKD